MHKKKNRKDWNDEYSDLVRQKRKSLFQILLLVLLILTVFFGRYLNGDIFHIAERLASPIISIIQCRDDMFHTPGLADLFPGSSGTEADGARLSAGQDDILSVSFLDVGQGSATLIECGGEAMLVDTGNYDAEQTLLSFLDKRGVEDLKYLILTHPDADHIANADEVIERCRIGSILTPDVSKDTYTAQDLDQTISTADVSDVHPSVGDEYSLGYASFTILGPVTIDEENVNNSSIALKLIYGDTSFVMMGDAEAEEESAILLSAPIELEADVLLVGHHGSSSSTTKEFLDAVDPTYAVISVGTNLVTWESPFPMANEYHHPHPSVIRRLRENDCQIYATEATENWTTGSGTVTALSDGTIISWEHER